MKEWQSIEWLSWSKISEFDWARPYVLYTLLAIPILLFIRTVFKNRTQIGLPIAPMHGNLQLGWSRYLRFLPAVFVSMALGFIIIALARPQLSVQTQNKISEGVDIILAIDISQSMLNRDISPNRIEASKKMAKDFVKGRYQDRIGIVLFSGEAYSLSPLTTDYETLNEYISQINPKMISADGTAIGSALAVSINRLQEANSQQKIIILISDGDNTAGNLDPLTAAQLAKAYNVKLYTILVGAISNTNTKDTLAAAYNSSIDEQVLKTIATTADGKFFRATNSKSLKEVFSQINNLEKVKYIENSSKEIIDVFPVYLRWAIVFLLLTFFTKITFIGNILED
jgi:Ca-activated chloride channel homolog